MKKLFMRNKVLFALALIILICFIVIISTLVIYFYSGNGKDKYGSRLNGIDNYKLDSKIDENIAAYYADTTYFDKVSVDVKGKIIYIIINLKENVALLDAQSIGIKALEAFTEEEKAFYDIQLVITAEDLSEESSLFPLLGYLNAKNSQVVWTNNR